MTAFCSYKGGESCMPLIYCFVYDVLSNDVPHTQQALTARRRHLHVSHRPAVALQPRSYNQRGTYLGCLGATGREKWSLASLGIKVWLCHVPSAQMHCLLEYEIVQPGVKVNGDYYREVPLKEKLLPCIKEISGDNFIAQRTCTQGAIDQWHEWLTTDISSFTRYCGNGLKVRWKF